MSEPTPQPSRLHGLIIAGLVVNLAALGYFGFQGAKSREELAKLQEESAALRRGIELLRIEATSQYEGYGFHALLDHLSYWAPQMQKASSGTLEFYDVEKRVENIIAIMGQLKDAFERIETTIREGGIAADDPATDDEIRKWLLRAALTADPERGRDLYAEVLRAETIDPSNRLRRIAVGELIQIDKTLTGEILHKILDNESSRSIARPGAQGTPGLRRRQPQFYHYIDFYVATGHKDAEVTLRRLLSRPEHDLITKQACVKALGDMGSRPSASILKKLYWEQHTPHAGHIPNPVFRLKILNAIVRILGAEAKDFLQEVDRKESAQSIRARLTELKKEFSF